MDVQALNITARLALLTDGRTVPITNLFDAMGDETDDLAEAVSFVCGAGRVWLSDRLDSVIAADTLINSNGDRIGYTPKVGRANGLLYGASGSTAWCWAFRSWVAEGAKGDFPKPPETAGGFIVLPDDTLIMFHVEGMERRTGLPFHADGSGADYALGAMQVGATPEQAVRAAMVWDAKTGGEITVLTREG